MNGLSGFFWSSQYLHGMSYKESIAGKKLIQQARDAIKSALAAGYTDQNRLHGRGIVVCAGGYKYFTNAWVSIKMLRHVGCNLPVQLWYVGRSELDFRMERLMRSLDVECIDAGQYMAAAEGSNLKTLKAIAISKSSFEEILYLDADNVVVKDPSFLFDLPQYVDKGAVFWPDTEIIAVKDPLWSIFQLPYIEEPQVEGGQLLVNKRACSRSLQFVEQLNFRAKILYKFAKDGKDLFRFAWRKMGQSYAMPEFAPQMLTIPNFYGEAIDAVLCQSDFTDDRLFQHRTFCKWDLHGQNPWISGFLFESKCHEFVEELKTLWNGRIGKKKQIAVSASLLKIKNTIARNRWILELPEATKTKPKRKKSSDLETANEENRPDFVKAPDVGKVNFKDVRGFVSKLKRFKFLPSRRLDAVVELRFNSSGAIEKGGSQDIGYFWGLSQGSNSTYLILSLADSPMMKLKLKSDGSWMGTDGARLRNVEDAYPHLKLDLQHNKLARVNRKIAQSIGKELHVGCSPVFGLMAEELSDHITAVYACAGLARLGVEVTFHTPFVDWLSRVNEPKLAITNKPHKSLVNVNIDYSNQIRFGNSKASWYAAAIHPFLKPSKPKIKSGGITQRFPFTDYIVLAPDPGNEHLDRGWPETHWARLAILLQETGCEIVAIGASSQAATLLKIFSKTQAYWVVGQTAEWTADVLLGAKAFVGVNNDLMHMAALLNVPAVAIHSQLSPLFLWPESKIVSVMPETPCSPCRWQEDRGYRSSCHLGCAALGTIAPEIVYKSTLKLIETGVKNSRNTRTGEKLAT